MSPTLPQINPQPAAATPAPTCTHPAESACLRDVTSLVSTELFSLQSRLACWWCCNKEATFTLSLVPSSAWYDCPVFSVSPHLCHRSVFSLSGFFLPLIPLISLEFKRELPSLSGLWLCLITGWVIDVSMTHNSDARLRCQHNICCFPAPPTTHCVWIEYMVMVERVSLFCWDVLNSKAAVPELFDFGYPKWKRWVLSRSTKERFSLLWLFQLKVFLRSEEIKGFSISRKKKIDKNNQNFV